MSTRGADRIVQALLDHRVETVFGLPGVHNLALWEALRATGSIRLVGVRHEQAAVYAADGLARASGSLGVALTTTGPGAANAVAATGEAYASRSPVLVIATDIPTTLRRDGVVRGALHETRDQPGLFRSVVHAALRAGSAEEVAPLAAEAVRLAMAARRPVYLEVPTDLLAADAPPAPASSALAAAAEAAPEDAARAAELIAAAERPLIWVGRDAVDEGAAIGELALALGAPVLTSYGARGVLAADHRCLVGLPPHVPEAGDLWDEADLVIVVRDGLDGMNTQNWTMPQPPALVAVNRDRAEAAINYRPDAVVEAIDPAWSTLRPAADSAALGQRLAQRRDACRTRLAAEHPREIAFLDAVARSLPPETVIVADMCIPGYWLAGFHACAGPRRLLYPVGWGTLGFAFPASLGAAVAAARSGAPAVSINGDGGFLFACGELATIAQERIPVTTVIVDDGGYGMLRYDQDRAGSERFGVDLQSPDFVALAQAFGLPAEEVDDLDERFATALAAHVADPEPSVLVARAPALTPPPTTSPRWYRLGR